MEESKKNKGGAPIGNKNAIGNNGGAPKIGLEVLWEAWYNDILSLYSEGASDVEIRALIYEKTDKETKMSYTLWDRWMQEEVEFSETIKIGRLLSESWWHKEGRSSLRDKDFNYTGWYMQMKNRFGWADNKKVDHTTKGEKITKIERVIVDAENNNT